MWSTEFNNCGFLVKILHSTGLEFQHQVEEAKDLDQLIKIHYRYLSTIHDRCLLREKVCKKKCNIWCIEVSRTRKWFNTNYDAYFAVHTWVAVYGSPKGNGSSSRVNTVIQFLLQVSAPIL